MNDVAGEIGGRNRALRRLVVPAADSTRSAYSEYIELNGRSQLEGAEFKENDRLADSLAELQRQSAISVRQAESKLQGLLATTNRARARDLRSVGSLPSGPAYARFAWILGVAGSHDPGASGTLTNFLAGAAGWYAESLIAVQANPAESNLLAIGPLARHQRMEGGGMRFRWVCDMFAQGIDLWATERGGRAAELFGEGRTSAFSVAIGRELPIPIELEGWQAEALLMAADDFLDMLDPDYRDAEPLRTDLNSGADVLARVLGRKRLRKWMSATDNPPQRSDH